MERIVEVAIVGAGPYGLSMAAHMQGAGISCVVFGKPMQFWAEQVPPRTMLKSDGASSDLVDPKGILPVSNYYAEQARPFHVTTPIPIETFVAYGRAFQKRFAPECRASDVVELRTEAGGFRLRLEDGSTWRAARVVLAVGLNGFPVIPEALRALPPSLVTHSAEYGPVERLVGKKVAVVGSGASAIDVAAVAQEAGAEVTLVVDRPAIPFNAPPQQTARKLRQRIRRPDTGIGAGWNYWFYSYGGDLFRLLPAAKRRHVVRQSLGAAPGWFMRNRIEGKVSVITSRRPARAVQEGSQVRLSLRGKDNAAEDLVVDHVVTATGYNIDMYRLPFLDRPLVDRMKLYHGAPVLSRHFETSVRGLYVVGPAAAFCFGPVMRFVYGAGFAIPRVARHLRRLSRVQPAASAPMAIPVAMPMAGPLAGSAAAPEAVPELATAR